MKKFLVSLMIAGLLMFGGNALAETNVGGLGVDVVALGGGVDGAFYQIPNGMAGGISGAGGFAVGTSDGFEVWGSVSAHLTATGGGITGTDAYRFNPGYGDKSIGVGSSSQNFKVVTDDCRTYTIPGATTHASADLSVRALFGGADALIVGAAGQGTLNFSTLDGSPRYGWESEGHTAGIAGQGSVGGFVGGALIGSVLWYPASANISAGIDMGGWSVSESYRYIDWTDGSKTEGMGTEVGAGTTVNSYGNNGGSCFGLTYVEGGWVAVGGAATHTTQTTNSGGAKASATGFYAGAGELGDSFNGSAVGYSGTSITTVTGMNGSISYSQAGMTVSTQSVPE